MLAVLAELEQGLSYLLPRFLCILCVVWILGPVAFGGDSAAPHGHQHPQSPFFAARGTTRPRRELFPT